jgi:type VI secretion system protein ImpK
MSTHVTPLARYRGSTSALDQRGWNLPLTFQEILTAIVRLRHNRQTVSDAGAFRTQMKTALKAAEQEARTNGYSAEDTKRVIFGVVAFLDESVLGSRNPVFSDWPRLPLQTELFGHQNAGEIVFQDIQRTLSRGDAREVADILEVYCLLLLLGFKGRYASTGKGDLRAIMDQIREKIQRVRGSGRSLSPRGMLPSDAIRIAPSDPWIRKFAIGALIAVTLTVALFVAFKILLTSGATSFLGLAPGAN